ncbi:hypothetical protein C8N43_1842 [Litoreibacter ponti]|uniref:Uncharacterized protein n=1 Tax=Litoreibacter ponti TaxID=1510457 RepID=A0A2T6BM89_9RHOB|nr:hypothetical protein [Litoreibacter ponti]PTX57176.1 hypothetical protein C8N43_1842 [Litoreibacter ponti]
MIAVLALSALPAQAMTLTEMSASIEACHTPAPIEETVAALGQEGWIAVDGPLGPEIIELLIWPQVAFYATGDTGGAQIRAIVDLQRKTVAGFARKADIPQSKTRILTRQIGADREAVLVFWLQPDPATTNIICRFALSPHSMIAHTAGDFGPPSVAQTTPTQRFSITPMNAASLAAKIDAPVTVSGTLETQFSFPSQE